MRDNYYFDVIDDDEWYKSLSSVLLRLAPSYNNHLIPPEELASIHHVLASLLAALLDLIYKKPIYIITHQFAYLLHYIAPIITS